MILRNLFLPHKDTHQKAKLISWNAILIYILLFILLQVGFSIISYTKPGVLGISSNIDQKKLITLTNQERQKLGLAPVSENSALDQAAQMKAQNMLAENYWAHFAPSGKTPWDFILGAGYKFTFAGENLAKNFYDSDAVVTAWMASPTHRDNLLNSKYKDIGIAVVDGVLNGQKTTLIVQMFGTSQYITPPQIAVTNQVTTQKVNPPQLTTQPKVAIAGKEIEVPKKDLERPLLVAAASENKQTSQNTKPILDPYQISKTAGFSVVGLIIALLLVDLLVLYRRRVFRISSLHFAHMALLSVTAASLLTVTPGNIL